MKDFGWIATLIVGIATGFLAFFAATGLAIFSILFYNAGGHHADFAASYKFVGAPVGALVMVLALGYLGTFWVKRVFRRG